MGYVVDRAFALRAEDVVLVLALRQRGARSRLLLRDGSLLHTPTRPRTLCRALDAADAHGYWFIGRKSRRKAAP